MASNTYFKAAGYKRFLSLVALQRAVDTGQIVRYFMSLIMIPKSHIRDS